MSATKTHNSRVCGRCARATKMRCSRCKLVWYCSARCQIKNWPAHQAVCVEMPSLEPQPSEPITEKPEQTGSAPEIVEPPKNEPVEEKLISEPINDPTESEPVVEEPPVPSLSLTDLPDDAIRAILRNLPRAGTGSVSLVSTHHFQICESHWHWYHLTHSDAFQFWTSNWPNQRVVPYEEFWEKLVNFLTPTFENSSEKPWQGRKQLLKKFLFRNSALGQSETTLLAPLTSHPESDLVVTLANFGNLLKWVGPLNGPAAYQITDTPEQETNLFSRLICLSKYSHFYGNLGYNGVHSFVRSPHATGFRFVHLDQRIPPTVPLLIFLWRHPFCYHLSIHKDVETSNYSCKYNEGSYEGSSVIELIEKVRQGLGLVLFDTGLYVDIVVADESGRMVDKEIGNQE